MSKVNAVICDSGISVRQLDYIKAIDIGMGWKDENGHGSQVAEVNSSLFDKVSISSIKILDSMKQCGLDIVFSALEVINDLDVDIVCLALAVDEDEISTLLLNDMKERLHKITKQGKIIVSSLHNKKNSSYPASLGNVIGVRMIEPHHKMDFYDSQKSIQCELQLESVICESKDGFYQPFKGNSNACAFFLGHICSTFLNYGKRLTYNELELIFNNQTINDLSFTNNKLSKSKHITYERLSEINLFVTQFIEEFFDGLNNGIILDNIKDIQSLNDMIHSLSNFGYKINKKTFLKFSDLKTIETLSNYLLLQGGDI